MAERTMVGIQVLWVVLAVCWKVASTTSTSSPPAAPPPASPPALDGAHDCGGGTLVRFRGPDARRAACRLG